MKGTLWQQAGELKDPRNERHQKLKLGRNIKCHYLNISAYLLVIAYNVIKNSKE